MTTSVQAAVREPVDAPRSQVDTKGGFITELHGVRGIALALVVLFHIFGQGRVSGGVDIFLFFSGFLLTGSMYRRSVSAESGRVFRHYSRTLLRLLPAALVVLAATTAAVLWIRPLAAQQQDIAEILASLLYFENFELINSQLSYGAAGPDASPLQHFWSLAVQGQFFLVWPLVVVALVAVGRRLGRPLAVTFAGVAVLTAVGFVWSQVMTSNDQAVAYFHTMSRYWELSTGGVLALALMRWSPPPRIRPLAAWGGLALVVASGFVVDGAEAFPGPWVLFPLSGAALVLIGARAVNGPARLLNSRPLTALADIAYELYLWHWPVLVLMLVIFDQENADLRTAGSVLVISVIAATLTYYGISRPVLRLRRAQPRWVIAAAVVLIGAATYGIATIGDRVDAAVERAEEQATLRAQQQDIFPGARVISDPRLQRDVYPEPALPSLELARLDREPQVNSECWLDRRSESVTPIWCEGSADSADADANSTEAGADSARAKVALVGSSRALMWFPAIEQAAKENGWSFKATARGSCPLQVNARTEGCRQWNANVIKAFERDRPDVVIVEGTDVSSPGAGAERLGESRRDAWAQLDRLGIEVIALRAGPRYSEDPPECLLRNGLSTKLCDVAASEMYSAQSPFKAAGIVSARVHEVDLTAYFCPENRCSAVIGNVVTARDQQHFTFTFSRTLSGPMANAVIDAVPRLAGTPPPESTSPNPVRPGPQP